jgi:hypothetical protein
VVSQVLHVVCQFWPVRNLTQHAHGPCSVAVSPSETLPDCPLKIRLLKINKWSVSDFVKAPALRRQVQCSVTFNTLIEVSLICYGRRLHLQYGQGSSNHSTVHCGYHNFHSKGQVPFSAPMTSDKVTHRQLRILIIGVSSTFNSSVYSQVSLNRV